MLDFLDLGLLARTTLAEFWDSVDKKQTGQEVTMFVYVYKNKKLKKKKDKWRDQCQYVQIQQNQEHQI